MSDAAEPEPKSSSDMEVDSKPEKDADAMDESDDIEGMDVKAKALMHLLSTSEVGIR